MSAQRPRGTADARCFRFDHTVTAVAVVSGFVFHAPWVIPVFAALQAATTLTGEESPLPVLWHTLFSPRLRRRSGAEDTAPWRTAAGCNAALLGGATLALVVVGEGLAWVLALPAAALAALAGMGGLCVGCELYARRRRRGG